MTSSPRIATPSSVRSRRHLGTLLLVGLALAGSVAPVAYGEPDTNIQKPGHLR
jgi:hypothetical protein